MPGIPESVILSVVENQTASFASGFGLYHRIWVERVVPILKRHNVPSLEYAKYKAFTNELLSKVTEKGTIDIEALITKWVGQRCDPEILREIAEAILSKKEEHE